MLRRRKRESYYKPFLDQNAIMQPNGTHVQSRRVHPNLLRRCTRSCCCSIRVGILEGRCTWCSFPRKNLKRTLVSFCFVFLIDFGSDGSPYLIYSGTLRAFCSSLGAGRSLFCRLGRRRGRLPNLEGISPRRCRRRCNGCVRFGELESRRPGKEKVIILHTETWRSVAVALLLRRINGRWEKLIAKYSKITQVIV